MYKLTKDGYYIYEDHNISISEIDLPAIKSYTAIYGDTFNYGDISKIEKLKEADGLIEIDSFKELKEIDKTYDV